MKHKLNYLLLALIIPILLFVLAMLSGGEVAAQNQFFVQPDLGMQQVESQLKRVGKIELARTGENLLQATVGKTTVQYKFNGNRLKDIQYLQPYNSKNQAGRELRDLLDFFDRTLAVVVLLEEKEDQTWYCARTPAGRFDLKLFQDANRKWVVMLQRTSDAMSATNR